MPSTTHLIKEIIYDPRIIYMLAILYARPPNSIAWKVRRNPSWFKLKNVKSHRHIIRLWFFLKDVNTFNDPELHRMEQTAALGIGTARDLGKIFALMLDNKLISKQLIDKFRTPQISTGVDYVVLAPMVKGHGFMYERHPKYSV